MIKVCFISPKAYPLFDERIESVFGGAEVDVVNLSEELAKDSNYKVSVVVADYGQKEAIIKNGLEIIKSLKFKQPQIVSAYKIWKTLKKTDSDIYIIKTASPGVFLTYLFCKCYDRKFIYRTAHKRETDGTYFKYHPILGRLFEYSLKRSDVIFCQNKEDSKRLKQRLNLDSIVVPNAHLLPNTNTAKRDFILWVGRSTEIKRPELFLKLSKQNLQEKFVMICQRATGDLNYPSLVEKAKQIPNLQFIERVPYHKIGDYFLKAKLFVNTSIAEGFPNTFIEAGKYSVPLLSLNVDPDNYIDKFSVGKCAQDNWTKFQENFQELIKPQTSLELGKNNRCYVENKHNITKTIEIYKNTFMEITHGK